MVFTSEWRDVLTNLVVLFQVLVFNAGDRLLVKPAGNHTRLLLSLEISLLYRLTKRLRYSLLGYLVVLRFHCYVDLRKLRDIFLLSYRRILETTSRVVKIFGCLVHRFLKSCTRLPLRCILGDCLFHLSETQLWVLVAHWVGSSKVGAVVDLGSLHAHCLVVQCAFLVIIGHLVVNIFEVGLKFGFLAWFKEYRVDIVNFVNLSQFAFACDVCLTILVPNYSRSALNKFFVLFGHCNSIIFNSVIAWHLQLTVLSREIK